MARITGPYLPTTTWMSEHTLFVDRGCPEVPWVVCLTVGNHRIYKEHGQDLGFPRVIAKELRKAGYLKGKYLAKNSLQVPGQKNMWWVPNWNLPVYVRELDKTWNRFREIIEDVSFGNPKRYLGTKEAHRKWVIKPWVKEQLGRYYPDHSVLSGMGFEVNRDLYIEERSQDIMKNYPSPQDLVDAVENSKPFAYQPGVAMAPADQYGMWNNYRVNKMALAALDLNYWAILDSMKKVKKFLELDKRTGKYPRLFPVNDVRLLTGRVNRLCAWEGPGHDPVFKKEMEDFTQDMVQAPQSFKNIGPDNHLRTYFLNRLMGLQLAYSNKAYQDSKKTFWLTGDPAAVIHIPKQTY